MKAWRRSMRGPAPHLLIIEICDAARAAPRSAERACSRRTAAGVALPGDGAAGGRDLDADRRPEGAQPDVAPAVEGLLAHAAGVRRVAEISFTGTGPMSWHLTAREREQIESPGRHAPARNSSSWRTF